MGAWGHKPFENDSALDWLSLIETHASQLIGKALRRVKPNRFDDGYHEAIAAAALLAEQTSKGARIRISYEAERDGLFVLAIKALGIILDNTKWIDTWRHPETIRHECEQLRRRLRSLKAAATRRNKRLNRTIRLRKKAAA